MSFLFVYGLVTLIITSYVFLPFTKLTKSVSSKIHMIVFLVLRIAPATTITTVVIFLVRLPWVFTFDCECCAITYESPEM